MPTPCRALPTSFATPAAPTTRRGAHAILLAFVIGVMTAALAHGHATGENYVWLNVEPDHLEGRFEIRLDDLEAKLGFSLPEDLDAARTVARERASEIQQYLRAHFALEANGADIPLQFTGTDVVEVETLGRFVHYAYRTASMVIPDELQVRNRILFEDDRFHRSLLCIEYDKRGGATKEYGEEFTALLFSPSNDEQVLDLNNIDGLLRVRDFIWQGVLHIWIGIDHVLFLIALLLTAVLVRRKASDAASNWEPVDRFQAGFWNVVKIVTIFTVAHSITLRLAALDIIRLPSRLVESIIALSIVLVAANNLFPRFRESRWLLIFGFGLFHGMGFASVMGELPFRMGSLVKVVVAFNIGVELGQLAIVAVVFPLIFLVRRASWYRPVVLVGGSILIGAMALYWFAERALGWG